MRPRSTIRTERSWALRMTVSCVALALVCGSEVRAQDKPVAIRARKLFLGTGDPVENGLVLMRDGKILAAGANVSVPADMDVLDREVVAPGFVDVMTRLGAYDSVLETARPLVPEARAALAIDLDHTDFRFALRSGVTTAGVVPWNRTVAAGRTAVIKTGSLSGRARMVREMGPHLLTTGTPAHSWRIGPNSSSGLMELLRERLASASKNGLADADLRRVARGEETVLLDCEGAELQAVLRLVSATGLDAGLLGVEDPTRSLRELVAAGRPVVLGPFELGARGRDLRAAAHLSAAGIDVAFTSAAPARSPEALRLSAALCIAQGMSEDAAFRALTTIPARLLGVADRVGTIERGRDADLVVWSGHPLDLSSRLEEVWIEGQRVFLAGDRQDASRRGLSSSRSGMGAREGRR